MNTRHELFETRTLDRAVELAAWLKVETENMRLRLKSELMELWQLELALRKVQDMLFDLQQEELFKEEAEYDRIPAVRS